MARVGLVLGAGGIAGHAYHVGVLSALAEETGWDPGRSDVVVGTSAGSVVGALLRAGFAPSDLAARALGRPVSDRGAALLERMGRVGGGDEWGPERPIAGSHPAGSHPAGSHPAGASLRPASIRGAVRSAFRAWELRPMVTVAGLLPEGRTSTERVVTGIRRLFGTARPHRALWLCALDLDRGRRVVFGREGSPPADVATAVAASCAIPGYFAPVEVGGARYVDGGVHSVTNVDTLAGEGLDLIVVSAPMSVAADAVRPSLDVAARLAAAGRLRWELGRVRRGGTPVVAFEPGPADLAAMGPNPMDPARREAVLRQARASALRRLRQAPLQERLAALAG